MREFEQMEMQYFVKPETAAARSRIGCRGGWRGTCATASAPARLRFREHRPDELAHYAKKAVDVE